MAIKFLERGSNVSKSVLREILNHRLLVAHPYIVKFREVFLTSRFLGISMEFAAGGDMFDYVCKHKLDDQHGLPEDHARHFFQQLMVGLGFAHELGIANRWAACALAAAQPAGRLAWLYSKQLALQSLDAAMCRVWLCAPRQLLKRDSKGVLSLAAFGSSQAWCTQLSLAQVRLCLMVNNGRLPCRDIKLENTLLDIGKPLPSVRICDFGYSKNEFVDSRPKTLSGTPDYIAPEVLLNDNYDGKKADIWSCGVLLFVLFTGESVCLAWACQQRVSQPQRYAKSGALLLLGLGLPAAYQPALLSHGSQRLCSMPVGLAGHRNDMPLVCRAHAIRHEERRAEQQHHAAAADVPPHRCSRVR